MNDTLINNHNIHRHTSHKWPIIRVVRLTYMSLNVGLVLQLYADFSTHSILGWLSPSLSRCLW